MSIFSGISRYQQIHCIMDVPDLEDIPDIEIYSHKFEESSNREYLSGDDDNEIKNRLRLKFLQAKEPKTNKNLSASSSSLLEDIKQEINKNIFPNEIIKNNIIEEVSSNSDLASWLTEPKTMEFLKLMESNPSEADKQLKKDPEKAKMFANITKILGNNFQKIVDKNDIPIESEQDKKVRQALSDADVRNALLDQDVKLIIENLKTNPDKGNYMFMSAKSETKHKIQKLIESGVLMLQNRKIV